MIIEAVLLTWAGIGFITGRKVKRINSSYRVKQPDKLLIGALWPVWGIYCINHKTHFDGTKRLTSAQEDAKLERDLHELRAMIFNKEELEVRGYLPAGPLAQPEYSVHCPVSYCLARPGEPCKLTSFQKKVAAKAEDEHIYKRSVHVDRAKRFKGLETRLLPSHTES